MELVFNFFREVKRENILPEKFLASKVQNFILGRELNDVRASFGKIFLSIKLTN